nr:MAG TPA: hypothetical protein [Caudoviricetes sp.]
MQRLPCSGVLPRIARPSLAPVPSDSIAGPNSKIAGPIIKGKKALLLFTFYFLSRPFPLFPVPLHQKH